MDYLDLKSICRTCKTEFPEMKSLYSNVMRNDNSHCYINEMLTVCTSIEVNAEDGLPQFICLPCFIRLKSAYSFIKQCESTETYLRKYVDNIKKDIKEEILPNIEYTLHSGTPSHKSVHNDLDISDIKQESPDDNMYEVDDLVIQFNDQEMLLPGTKAEDTVTLHYRDSPPKYTAQHVEKNYNSPDVISNLNDTGNLLVCINEENNQTNYEHQVYDEPHRIFEDLNSHSRIHTEIMQRKDCDNSYTTRDVLRKHETSHIQITTHENEVPSGENNRNRMMHGIRNETESKLCNQSNLIDANDRYFNIKNSESDKRKRRYPIAQINNNLICAMKKIQNSPPPTTVNRTEDKSLETNSRENLSQGKTNVIAQLNNNLIYVMGKPHNSRALPPAKLNKIREKWVETNNRKNKSHEKISNQSTKGSQCITKKEKANPDLRERIQTKNYRKHAEAHFKRDRPSPNVSKSIPKIIGSDTAINLTTKEETHAEIHELGEYKCNNCPKSFCTMFDMRFHSRSHSDARGIKIEEVTSNIPTSLPMSTHSQSTRQSRTKRLGENDKSIGRNNSNNTSKIEPQKNRRSLKARRARKQRFLERVSNKFNTH